MVSIAFSGKGLKLEALINELKIVLQDLGDDPDNGTQQTVSTNVNVLI